ncbi:MAG: ATP-binding protein, partial [Chloroflexi bacterium]|nr:ATP-binding protein [Chloroflexota bacterium]
MELLERESYLSELHILLGKAAGGDGRMVLINGEAGIGKTSLIERFAHDQHQARVLWGVCDLL